jgi:hypothetical protein
VGGANLKREREWKREGVMGELESLDGGWLEYFLKAVDVTLLGSRCGRFLVFGEHFAVQIYALFGMVRGRETM